MNRFANCSWPLDGDTKLALIFTQHSASILCFHRQLYKERLNLPIKAMIGYQSHDDTSSKSGSTTKNMYSVWTPPRPFQLAVDLNNYHTQIITLLIFWVVNYCSVLFLLLKRELFIVCVQLELPPTWEMNRVIVIIRRRPEKKSIWKKMSYVNKRTQMNSF